MFSLKAFRVPSNVKKGLYVYVRCWQDFPLHSQRSVGNSFGSIQATDQGSYVLEYGIPTFFQKTPMLEPGKEMVDNFLRSIGGEEISEKEWEDRTLHPTFTVDDWEKESYQEFHKLRKQILKEGGILK